MSNHSCRFSSHFNVIVMGHKTKSVKTLLMLRKCRRSISVDFNTIHTPLRGPISCQGHLFEGNFVMQSFSDISFANLWLTTLFLRPTSLRRVCETGAIASVFSEINAKFSSQSGYRNSMSDRFVL